MPTFSKFSDAAIAIGKVLDELGVDFGIFGGFAIAALGGPRESKDIDCAVNCDKERLVQELSRVEGFRSMGNSREDLAQFIFGNANVLLELFPMSMENVRSLQIRVAGESGVQSTTKLLDAVTLFKGKLQAAAIRSKHSDAADLLWLEGKFNSELKARNTEYHKGYIGMATFRYPHLELAFVRLDVDIGACKTLVSDWDPKARQPPPQIGEVQKGLTYGVRNLEDV